MSSSEQIAIRLDRSDLEALDAAIAEGRFPNRAAAVREALKVLLAELRERVIEEAYRKAYTEHPQEEWVGEVGLRLMAENIKQLESER